MISITKLIEELFPDLKKENHEYRIFYGDINGFIDKQLVLRKHLNSTYELVNLNTDLIPNKKLLAGLLYYYDVKSIIFTTSYWNYFSINDPEYPIIAVPSKDNDNYVCP